MDSQLFVQYTTLVIGFLAAPVISFFAFWFNHREIDIWRTAAIGGGSIIAGLILAHFGHLSEIIQILYISNILVIYGHYKFFESISTIYERPVRQDGIVIYMTSYMALLGLVILFGNQYQHRVTLTSLFIAIVSIFGALKGLNSISLQLKNKELKYELITGILILSFLIGNIFFALSRSIAALNEYLRTALNFDYWDEAFFVWILTSMFFISMGILVSGSAQISRRAQEGFQRERQLKENLERSLLEQTRLKKIILHEVKQPLNAFSTQIELAIKNETPLKGQSLSKIFYRMKDTISFIRSLGEIDELNEIFKNPNYTELSIDNVISNISLHNSVTVVGTFSQREHVVDLDLVLFDIALGNIIDNAVKFGRDTEPDVQLELSGNFLRIDVRDQGDGIGPEEQELVFELFNRGRAAQALDKPGYGIGLHIARRIAELHGGECFVSSCRPSVISLIFPTRSIREASGCITEE